MNMCMHMYIYIYTCSSGNHWTLKFVASLQVQLVRGFVAYRTNSKDARREKNSVIIRRFMTLNLASFQTIPEWPLNGTIQSGTLQMLYLCGHFWNPEFFQHIFTASNTKTGNMVLFYTTRVHEFNRVVKHLYIQNIYIHPKPSSTTHRRLESSHEADPPDRGLGFWICLKIKNRLIFSKHLYSKHKKALA